MRFAQVTTYPPSPCGIGRYTRNLRLTMTTLAPGDQFPVIAEQAEGAELDPGVVRSWHRKRGDWLTDMMRDIGAAAPDLVHIQHEEAILNQDSRMPRLIAWLHAQGIASVVTLHSVYGGRLAPPGRWRPSRFHRGMVDAGAHLIVHQHAGSADVLERQGVATDHVHVIAHGTLHMDLPERAEARARLDLPADAEVVLFFGVIHPKKNVHTLVRAFGRVAAARPNARLVIAGNPRRRNPLDTLYAAALERLGRRGRRDGWLDYRRGFVPDELMPAYFAAADVIALPHRQTYGSASGVLHMALAARKAIICSRGPKFAEAFAALAERAPELFPAASSPRQWARALDRALGDADLRREIGAAAADMGKKTAWPVVAGQTLALYRRAVAELRGEPAAAEPLRQAAG